MHYAPKKHKSRMIFCITVCVAMLIVSGVALIDNLETVMSQSTTRSSIPDTEPFSAVNSNNWALILVNRENPLPKNYMPQLTELANGQRVDARILPDLQAMFDDMRNTGVYPQVTDGYRSTGEQQQILEDKIQEYKAQGYGSAQAKKLAEQWVAVPGTSEHQLGLALDINPDDSGRSSGEEVYAWLCKNAHQYGFILRYPANKTQITGIIYEPWHFRYVGRSAAQEIYARDICLEEYLK